MSAEVRAPAAPKAGTLPAGTGRGTGSAGLGVMLDNGVCIAHGAGANVMVPLQGFDVTMHELYAGEGGLSFGGQFGFIDFHTDCRLPRHVHMAADPETGALQLLPERILVLGGVAMAELGGAYFVVAPGSLVDIPPGLPHTWNACPPGVTLPDGSVSNGRFTMVYNYSRNTRFFPTADTGLLRDASDYRVWEGDLQQIRFPVMTAAQVKAGAKLVWGRELLTDLAPEPA